jgi:DNA-binding NtrC family response regulator
MGGEIMPDKSVLEGKRVLIVDDEPDVLEVLDESLKMCQVAVASNFEKAKELLDTQNFDIAVLDIMGVDGYRLLEIAVRKDIPAVMLTAHAFTPDNLVRSIKEGAASYLPKEEMPRIAEFLIDVLEATKKGISPWEPWAEKLPSSYFEKRFGAMWRASDKKFLDQFRENLRPKVKDRGGSGRT